MKDSSKRRHTFNPPMDSQVSEIISGEELLKIMKTGSLLMVSGGPDSVFLFHLFIQLKKKHGIRFEVIHFNHHLRGSESDREQKFVEDLCAQFNVPCFVEHITMKQESGIQERSRKLRYQRALRLARKKRDGFILTAHHQDDFLETLVMKRGRGAGFKGLCGIRRVQSLNGVFLFRPLLGIPKKNILAYLSAHHRESCQDSSNLKKDYLRNRVRQDIMTQWVDPKIKDKVYKTSLKLQRIDHYMDERIKYLNRVYHYFVPGAVWASWPTEIQFRFFAYKMRHNGFVQQVEARHFQGQEGIKECKLTLGDAVFLRDSSGCYFLSVVALQEETTASLSESFTPPGKKHPVKLKEFYRSRGIPKYQRLFWPVERDGRGVIIGLPKLALPTPHRR